MNNWFFILITLGVIQGIAEFLPISSSGHLVILEQVQCFKEGLKDLGTAGIMFVNVALHIATLLALLINMRKDIANIVKGFFQGMVSRDFRKSEVRITLYIIFATIPAAIIGVLLSDLIENLFLSARVAFIFLIINGIILIFTKKITLRDRKLDEIGFFRSIGVGLFQAFAILPGISRSGMTITGGMLMGLGPVDSARFSFLMAIPVIIGASLLEGLKAVKIGFPDGFMPAVVTAMIITVIVALVSLRILFAAVKNIRINLFGYYTIAVGVAGLVALYLIA